MKTIFTLILAILGCIYSSVTVINSSFGGTVESTHQKQIELKKSFSMMYRGQHLRVIYQWDDNTYDVINTEGSLILRGIHADLESLENELSIVVPVRTWWGD